MTLSRRSVLRIVALVGALIGGTAWIVHRLPPETKPFSGRGSTSTAPGTAPPTDAGDQSREVTRLPEPKKEEKDAERARKLWEDVLFQFRANAYKIAAPSAGRFQAEAMSHFRQGRLLALAYPGEMELLLTGIARNASMDDLSRRLAITLLGVLAVNGRPGAETVLAEVASGTNKSLVKAALIELAHSDLKGAYLPLYVSKCKEGVKAAFAAASFWEDAGAIRALEAVQATSTGTSGDQMELRYGAEEALSKIRMLASPELEKQVQAILQGNSESEDWLPWAVKLAKMRNLSGSTEALRRHLDRVEELNRDSGSVEGRAEAALRDQVLGDRATRLAQGDPTGPQDALYDDALVAYWQLGGKLNEGERRRLYHFGYACEPRQRLEELNSTGK